MTIVPKTMLIAVALLVAAGCQDDFYARKIVKPNSIPGRIVQDITGSGAQRVERGQITLHRQVIGPDNLLSDVWVIRSKVDSAPSLGTVVLLHGMGESKASVPYPGVATKLAEAGFDAVLIDLRGHGRSGGKYTTYGAKEKYDVRAVVDALLESDQMTEPVYAFGANLGASVAIQYAAIDPRCKAVMAISPYQDAISIGWQICRFNAPTMSVEHFERVTDRSGAIADFDPAEASAVNAARQLKIPLLLIHGALDMTVPMEHTQAVYDAAGGPKKLESPIAGQILLLAVLEDWLAERIITLAPQGLPPQRR